MARLISVDAVKAGLAESVTLDFKQSTYADKDKREWLKDVTAFANTRGGRIIIGVNEDEHGQASSAIGIQVESLDKEIHKLQSWLREHTDPDVSGAVRITPETDEEGRKFLIIDIQESESGPHRIEVKSEKHTRHVYIRKGRDNVPASMFEIRNMILDSERTPNLISNFIKERQNSLEGSNPQGDVSYPYVAFHLCPKREFGSRQLVDYMLSDRTRLMTPRPDYWEQKRPNIWGVATNQSQKIGLSYIQYFYNGAAEFVFDDLVHTIGQEHDSNSQTFVVGARLRGYLQNELAKSARYMNGIWGCEEFALAVRFVGVGHLKLLWQRKDRFEETSRGQPGEVRFDLPLLSVRLGEDGQFLPEDKAYLLDLVWRAWGEEKCPL